MHSPSQILHDRPVSLKHIGGHAGSWDVAMHHHDTWEIIFQRTGHVQTQQGKDVIAMHPGMVLTHPPGVDHADHVSAPYSVYYILAVAPDNISWPRLSYDDAHQSIERTCDTLYREWISDSHGRDTLLYLLTQQLDTLLRRAHQQQELTQQERVVAEAQRILAERYRDAPTVAELARELGLSRTTLYDHFTQLRGQTPAEYVSAIRLRHALGLLHHSRSTLETIADLCGYHSASHLSRHVKTATGKSPGSLRREPISMPVPQPVVNTILTEI